MMRLAWVILLEYGIGGFGLGSPPMLALLVDPLMGCSTCLRWEAGVWESEGMSTDRSSWPKESWWCTSGPARLCSDALP